MKTFKITYVRSAFQTKTIILKGLTKATAVEVAWQELPAVEQFQDHPQMASYDIEKIEEVKPCTKAK